MIPWLLLIALHVRATWAGLVYSGFSDLTGWAAGQIFFLGIVILLAVLARSPSQIARLMPIPVAIIAFALAIAGWSTRTTGDTFRIFATESGKTRWQMLRSSAAAEADRLLVLDSLLAL